MYEALKSHCCLSPFPHRLLKFLNFVLSFHHLGDTYIKPIGSINILNLTLLAIFSCFNLTQMGSQFIWEAKLLPGCLGSNAPRPQMSHTYFMFTWSLDFETLQGHPKTHPQFLPVCRHWRKYWRLFRTTASRQRPGCTGDSSGSAKKRKHCDLGGVLKPSGRGVVGWQRCDGWSKRDQPELSCSSRFWAGLLPHRATQRCVPCVAEHVTLIKLPNVTQIWSWWFASGTTAMPRGAWREDYFCSLQKTLFSKWIIKRKMCS